MAQTPDGRVRGVAGLIHISTLADRRDNGYGHGYHARFVIKCRGTLPCAFPPSTMHTTYTSFPTRSLLRATVAALAATVTLSALGQTANGKPSGATIAKEQIARIRTLYACSHFAKEVAAIQTDDGNRAKLEKRVTSYAAKASVQAGSLDTPQEDANTRLVDAFADLGKADFAAFMHKTVAIADSTERAAALNAYAARCDREAAAQ